MKKQLYGGRLLMQNMELPFSTTNLAKSPLEQTWKALMKHCHSIHERIYYTLGDGASISFRKDTWLGDNPLHKIFPDC